MGITRLTRIAGLTLAAVACLSGCGSAGSGGAGSTTGTVLGVGERDFHIAAPARVPAGIITLRVHNRGPETHELFVVRQVAAHLPLRADGLTLDEDAIADATAASVDAIKPGATVDEHLHLKPGRYLLFCNMAGHFRGGMHRPLVVT